MELLDCINPFKYFVFNRSNGHIDFYLENMDILPPVTLRSPIILSNFYIICSYLSLILPTLSDFCFEY